MLARIQAIADEARLAARAILEFGSHLLHPTVRLGVTGLSGAGKTVLITALVHDLMHGARLPVFEPLASGRIARARLEPQPDDAVSRFEYERHVEALVRDRAWPESTRRVSELRLAIEYQSPSGVDRTLTLDIVDYPGEWLLDLPLLTISYREWSAQALKLSYEEPRRKLASRWHAHLATLDPQAGEDEQAALTAAKLFTDYLRACRDARYALSLLPPGRFLMPGDLANSPGLTFSPLPVHQGGIAPEGSLWAMMQRRYESYKAVVVRPFFRDHFARLDRQIVLVDVLAALDAGPEALADLETALDRVLLAFRAGRNSMMSRLFRPRIDRVLFAATKADHLHQSGHQRLEAILRLLVDRAARRTEGAGARVATVALASIRATHEVSVREGGAKLAAIAGTPEAGETVGDETFAGDTDAAVFPGELPEDPKAIFAGAVPPGSLRFPRFRPPPRTADAGGRPGVLPHIRLDRALEFLLGDRLA
jgi:predicted YcjX-like family ATPase